jgi:hypothetical protein
MALDLTPLRPSLEALILVDECEIWRDTSGALDDVVDPATGSIIGPTPDSVLVATTACKLKLVKRLPVTTPEGGEPVVVSNYELKVPVPIEPMDGDRVKMTVSPHHPSLVDRWLRVSETAYGSLTIFRLVNLEMRERVSDRP